MPLIETPANLRTRLPARRFPFGATAHERRVARIALRLFDTLAHRHRLAPRYRRVLELAALAHDAAKRSTGPDHHVAGARMILGDNSLPITDWHRRACAYLVRHHKGRVPDVRRDAILRPGDHRPKLRTLLSLLRAADALDARAVPSALAIRFDEDAGILHLGVLVSTTHHRAALAAFPKRAKFDLLERSLGLTARLTISEVAPDDFL